MKKMLVSLATLMTIGLCCSSVLASDLKVTVGYNCAPSKAYEVILKDTSTIPEGTLSALGGGGLVIGASLDTDIIDNLGVKVSITADYLNKSVNYTGYKLVPYEEGNETVYKKEKEDVSIDTKKWTLSGDALVKYAFNPIPNLSLGVQGGFNLISTSIFDGVIVSIDELREAIIRYVTGGDATEEEIQQIMAASILPSSGYRVINEGTGILKELFNVSGGSAVVGAFANYRIDDKMSIAADGYIGVMSFGNVVNPFKNCKVNASFSYSVRDNVNITAGFTFLNAALSKKIHMSDINAKHFFELIHEIQSGEPLPEEEWQNMLENNGGSIEFPNYDFNYTYRQLLPTVSVSYIF